MTSLSQERGNTLTMRMRARSGNSETDIATGTIETVVSNVEVTREGLVAVAGNGGDEGGAEGGIRAVALLVIGLTCPHCIYRSVCESQRLEAKSNDIFSSNHL